MNNPEGLQSASESPALASSQWPHIWNWEPKVSWGVALIKNRSAAGLRWLLVLICRIRHGQQSVRLFLHLSTQKPPAGLVWAGIHGQGEFGRGEGRHLPLPLCCSELSWAHSQTCRDLCGLNTGGGNDERDLPAAVKSLQLDFHPGCAN